MPDADNNEAAALGPTLTRADLDIGVRVIYPTQGLCTVTGFETLEIGGQRVDFVTLVKEEGGAVIKVATPKIAAIGLRIPADGTELDDVFDLLSSTTDDPELDWKARSRLHGDLLAAGGVLGVAEVVKALHALSRLRPLPPKERDKYDQARHLLVREIAASMRVPPNSAEDLIDFSMIPPAGVKRPSKKPRRTAVVAPRPQRLRGRPRPAGAVPGEEEGLLELEEDPLAGVEGEGAAEEPESTDDAADGARNDDGEAGGDEAATPVVPPKPAKLSKPAGLSKPAKASQPAKLPAAAKPAKPAAAKPAKPAAAKPAKPAAAKPAAAKPAAAKAVKPAAAKPAKPAAAKAVKPAAAKPAKPAATKPAKPAAVKPAKPAPKTKK